MLLYVYIYIYIYIRCMCVSHKQITKNGQNISNNIPTK